MNRTLACTTALAFAFAAPAARAVTPEEVWEGWQGLAASLGQDVTVGAVGRSGDTLEVTDLVLTFVDDLGASATVRMDRLTFTDLGEGRVQMGLPESYPMEMAFPETGEGPTALRMTISQPGLSLIASGEADSMDYALSGPSMTVSIDEIVQENAPPVTAEIVLNDLSGTYRLLREGDLSEVDTTLSAATLTAMIVGEDMPDGTPAEGTVRLVLTGVTATSKGALPGTDLMADLAAALNGGFTVDSTVGFDGMTLEANVEDTTGLVTVSGSAGPGSLAVALDSTRMTYSVTQSGIALSFTSPDPMLAKGSVSLGEYGYSLTLPTSKSDSPQDFGLSARLVDLTVSDDLWGLFDAAGLLSREPASFVLDVKGTGLLYEDLLNPVTDLDETDAPGELHSLEVPQALVRAAGAEVSATGGLTFDNSDLTSFGGMAAPTGSFTVTIKGVNALVDNLITLGVLAEEDAMGFRMGLAMFARPLGPDELSSLVEFRDGGFFVNGQQLQ